MVIKCYKPNLGGPCLVHVLTDLHENTHCHSYHRHTRCALHWCDLQNTASSREPSGILWDEEEMVEGLSWAKPTWSSKWSFSWDIVYKWGRSQAWLIT